MKKHLQRFALAAVVSLGLLGPGMAAGQTDAGTSTSPSLAGFLRDHKRVELFIPGLARFPLRNNRGFWANFLLIEDGRTFSAMAGVNLVCKAPVRVEGNRASGSCSFPVDYVDGKGPQRMDFSFSILATATTGGMLTYDVENICAGETCLRDRELCSRVAGNGETHDCTLLPVYEKPAKATPAGVREFLAAARDARFDLVYDPPGEKFHFVYKVVLHPDHRFCIDYPDRGDTQWSCCGAWILDGLRVRGRCEDAGRKFEGSSDFSFSGITVGGALFDARLCVTSDLSGSEKCAESKGAFWLPHGYDDYPWEKVVELIPGSKNTELFDAAVLQLRQMDKEPWGRFLPVLVRGSPARHPRLETELFYAADENESNLRLARAIAKLLADVVGPVEPRPWPGPSGNSVVVVVGERVANGEGKGAK